MKVKVAVLGSRPETHSSAGVQCPRDTLCHQAVTSVSQFEVVTHSSTGVQCPGDTLRHQAVTSVSQFEVVTHSSTGVQCPGDTLRHQDVSQFETVTHSSSLPATAKSMLFKSRTNLGVRCYSSTIETSFYRDCVF